MSDWLARGWKNLRSIICGRCVRNRSRYLSSISPLPLTTKRTVLYVPEWILWNRFRTLRLSGWRCFGPLHSKSMLGKCRCLFSLPFTLLSLTQKRVYSEWWPMQFKWHNISLHMSGRLATATLYGTIESVRNKSLSKWRYMHTD